MPHRVADIAGPNTYTSFLNLRAGDTCSIRVSGTFTALAVFQRSFDGVTDWQDVQNPDSTLGWSQPVETTYFADESCYVRIGVRTYSGGSVHVRIGTDREQIWHERAGMAALQGSGGMGVLGAVLSVVLMLFLAAPASAQLLCAEVAGHGRVCPPVNITMRAGFLLAPTTISSLGNCAAPLQGTLASLSNGADSRTAGDAVRAAGSSKVVVYCDGGDWRYIW